MKHLQQPRYAVMVLVILTYIWRFHDLTPALSQFRLAAIGTVLSWGYLLISPRASTLGRSFRLPYVALFLAFSFWGLITAPLALNPELAWSVWSNDHFKTTTMVLFVIGCLTSFSTVRLAVAAQMVGASVLAYFYIKAGFPQWGTPVPTYDRNDLALAFNITLPLVLFLFFTSRTHRGKWITGVSGLAIATCILMSQSRGGFLTLGVTVAVLLFIAEGIPLKVRIALPVVLALSLFALPANIQERLATILEPTADYNYTDELGRIEIWKRGMGYLGDNVVTGVGWKNFAYAEETLSEMARRGDPQPRVAHNSFVQVAVETGLVGLVLYVGMILAAVVRLFRIRMQLRRSKHMAIANDLYLLATFLLLSILGFCVGAQFLSRSYSPLLFVLIVLTAGVEMSVDQLRVRRVPSGRQQPLRRVAVGKKVAARPIPNEPSPRDS